MAAAIIPPITKLTANVIRVLGCNPGPMTLQGTNTYVVGSGKKRILIDAGDNNVPEYQKYLSHVIKSEHIDIEHIVITHWHRDHIGGIQNVFDLLDGNPKVWKFKRFDTDTEETDTDFIETIPFQWLTNRQVIGVEGATLEIHHTPGHTSDHIVLKLLEENVLFSGDCILGEGTAVFEDLSKYMESLYNILDLEPCIIFPGHGNVVTEPVEKIQYYIHHRNMRENQILNFMKENLDKCFSEMELVKVLYVDTPAELWPAAAYTVNHHLNKLNNEKKILGLNTDGGTKWQYIPYSCL